MHNVKKQHALSFHKPKFHYHIIKTQLQPFSSSRTAFQYHSQNKAFQWHQQLDQLKEREKMQKLDSCLSQLKTIFLIQFVGTIEAQSIASAS